VNEPELDAEQWAQEANQTAADLMTWLGGDPYLVQADLPQALNWLENRLNVVNPVNFPRKDLVPLMSRLMAFLGEVVIAHHNAHWDYDPDTTDVSKKYVLAGGSLKRPVAIHRIITDAFSRNQNLSVVQMLNIAELEGAIRVF